MENPRITIITITLNNAAGLRRTLESSTCQDYHEKEILVIDGGSADGTAEVIRHFSDNIAFWVSEPDKGIYDAMNKGLAHAAGEWVIFMNAGDIFHDNRVVSSVFSRDYKEAGVIYGDSIAQYPGFRVFRKAHTIDDLHKGMICCHQSMFFRTRLIRQEGYRRDLAFSGDYELVLRLHAAGVKFLYVPLTMAVFDTRGTSNVNMANSARANLEILLSMRPLAAGEMEFHRNVIRRARITERLYRCMPAWCTGPALRWLYRKDLVSGSAGKVRGRPSSAGRKALNVVLYPLHFAFRLVQDRMDFLRDYRLKLIIARVLRLIRVVSVTTARVSFPDTIYTGASPSANRKITVIDHSYHYRTGSPSFFIDLLRQSGTVRVIWDSRWNGGRAVTAERIGADNPDLVVLWQIMIYHHPKKLSALRCPNILVVPMYDDIHGDPDALFLRYRDFRFLSFSSTLHARLTSLDIRSRYFQYFVPPSGLAACNGFSNGLRGFFWQRTNDITWVHVRELIRGTRFTSFHLHLAIDPLWYSEILPSEEEMREYNITISRWFDKREDYLAVLSESNVFFAPRLYEGIGMPVLEAMAMGMVVVAPDHPTMNEYIRHGENGLLYDPANPAPLDFSAAAEMGRKAHEDSLDGWEKWKEASSELILYLRLNKIND